MTGLVVGIIVGLVLVLQPMAYSPAAL